ncbi:MAG: hypothetical protein R3360_04725, partial [Alphaproteobacteria bacterium]|nr:hypothetical protein [Alphaproteobacteria bacterium]
VCLEHGNFDFAHRVYVNGFLRAYAEYLGKETLGMSPDEAAEALKSEHPEVFEPEPEAIELQPLQPKGVPKMAVALVLFILIGAVGVAVWFWQENSPQTRIEAAPAVPEKLSLYLPADD